MKDEIKNVDNKIQDLKKIISIFPYFNDISEDSIIKIVNQALEIKLYFKSYEFIYSEVCKLNPKPTKIDYEKGSEFRNWLDWCDDVRNWANNYYLPLWRNANGDIRTVEEACELCAKIWMNKIFHVSLQDNGAWNEGENGAMMNIVGSALKTQAMSEISNEVKQKVIDGIRTYYMVYKHKCELGCDYDPCTKLYHILLDAGVPQNDIPIICPWKTYIKIMPEDNSVLVHTYQKDEYL